MRNLVLAVCIALGTLVACRSDGGASEATSPPVTSIGPLGVPEDHSSGLTGVDNDKNGVRDDVDSLILKSYSQSETFRRAVTQHAQALQRIMMASTKDEAVAADHAIDRALRCEFTVISDQDVVLEAGRRVEALTANTQERLRAYIHANALLSGSILPSYADAPCD